MNRIETITAGTIVAIPDSIAYTPDRHVITGTIAASVGMARLGNAGRRIDGCPCGTVHNVSIWAVATIVAN